MHTIIFLATYAILYKLFDFGRLSDGLELPLIFPLVLLAFVMYDMIKLGWIEVIDE